MYSLLEGPGEDLRSPLPIRSPGPSIFMNPVTTTLAIAGLLLPVLALLVYRWGYRAGVDSGKQTLEAYKAGMKDDGGCWVKAQPSAQPTSQARE